MALTFRDRFFQPRVARAIMSPSGILLAGAGAAIGILVGGGVFGALVLGAVAWAGRVVAAIPRRPAGDKIDPFRVGEPWRRFVQDALGSKRKFDQVVKRSRSGPIRDRLVTIGGRIDDGVREAWRIACQGDALDAGLTQMNVKEIQRDLQQVYDDRRRADDASLQRTQQAIEAQLASYQRLQKVATDAHDRLRLLNAQMDEAVARAVEISLRAADADALAPLSDDVDSVVGELEALRQGLEETSTPAPGETSDTPPATAGGTA
ncbi:MAG TPA: hypothetical protein VHN98_06900 [Acidimicrobiales bacterium]|nr:hypothetical protein [Acidimicrobiales bacterium]